MKTRGLKIVVNSDGVLKTRKVVKETKETQIQRIYANKIYKILLNTLNSRILNTQEFDSSITDDSNKDLDDSLKSQLNGDTNTSSVNGISLELSSEVEKLKNLVDKKFEGNNELYIKHISGIIANKCYKEYMDDSRMLKRKLFELYSNIKRENNVELRLKIILRKITINDLIKSDIIELAPENVKNIRKQRVEQHYARNVILSTDLDEDSGTEKVYSTTLDTTITNSNSLDDNTTGVQNNIDNSISNNTETSDTDTDNNPKPDITNYEYEKIHQNIIDKLNRLPVFLRKPFLDNMNVANKRIQLLFNRSSIINKV